MKKLKESLAAKLVAVILLIVSLLSFLLCAAGTGYLIYQGAYEDDSSSYASKGILKDALVQDVNHLIGQIDRCYIESEDSARSTLAFMSSLYPEEDSNVWFCISTTDGTPLVRNSAKPECLVEYHDYYTSAWSTENIIIDRYFDSLDAADDYASRYISSKSDSNHYYYDCYYDNELDSYRVVIYQHEESIIQLQIDAGIRSDLSARDNYRTVSYWMGQLYRLRYFVIVLCAISLVLSIVLLVYLLWSAGHKAGVDGIYLNWANQIPFDLFIAILLFIAVLPPAALNWSTYFWDALAYLLFIISIVLWCALLVWLAVSFAARAKAGAWWKNTVIYRLLRLIRRSLRWLTRGLRYVGSKLPVCWKIPAIWVAFSVVEVFICAIFDFNGLALLALQFLVVTPALLLIVFNLQTLQLGGRQLANGNLNYKVNTVHMLPDFRRHGEALNSISDGMQKAVEKQMSSERLKAELITNVSHDIKTPLTAIVSYVDLLKKPGNTPEQIQEYLNVLDRQSARLKKLTEDLIEASKASTGNIAVNLEPLDANMLLAQAVGEHSEKLAKQKLDLICIPCAQTPVIMADSKLIWRVFDNLLDNIRKYAMAGTRVYLTSHLAGGRVTITFRNISRDPLNITSDELMERFVRGDTSRNTEGSGLGLSIARSLVQLQKGNFDLSIDGDLFKAIITFDAVE